MAQSVFRKLEGVNELHTGDQQTLLLILKKELKAYSVFDLMKIQAHLEKNFRDLPPEYKQKLKQKLSEHLFVNFKSILHNDNFHDSQLDMELYREFLEWFKSRLDDDMPGMMVLYYLCALYNIFITKTPLHPEGTPFPGGFFVEKVEDRYYCPVKDNQKDNEEAICKYCIARQTDMDTFNSNRMNY
ncbi:MAG: DUF2115 domain-containing protein [Candidatus Methanoperedens sp.]|nr:DUF2115 domain-containing protein [Candidatus Methanoperedens sp.]